MTKTLPRLIPLLLAIAATACTATGAGSIDVKGLPKGIPSGISASSLGQLKDQAGEVAGKAGEIATAVAKFFTPLMQVGEYNDNALYADYLKFLEEHAGEGSRKIDVSQRRFIEIVDPAGNTVPGADVTITAGGKSIWKARSQADGRVLFFPSALPAAQGVTSFDVTAVKAGLTFSATFALDLTTTWQVQAQTAVAPSKPVVEILFLIDNTGSMGEELKRMQQTVDSIATRINAIPNRPLVRYGLIGYRDRGDEYVVKTTPLTPQLPTFKAALSAMKANGGGDYPEDIEAALATATGTKPSWNKDATVRLAFLIGDAPPHIDYKDSTSYVDSIWKAGELGLRFHVIATTQLQAAGVVFMRQLAQITQGHFMYVTRGGDGGVANAVGKYGEGRLDDIVVDLVKEEVGLLGRPAPAPEATPTPIPLPSAAPSAKPSATASSK